jgi:hypothetical protein
VNPQTPGGALEGGRVSVGDANGWLTSYVAQLVLFGGRDLLATIRKSVRRRLSGCGAARIRVSGMSGSWLQLHETDYEKHREIP